MPHVIARKPGPQRLQFGQSEARRLTDEVKREAASLWRTLVDLHDRGAHTVLGYSSWHAYCKAEFGFGPSHSYRLLDAGRIAAVVPHVGNEAQARPLVPLLRDHGEQAVIDVVREVFEQHGERAPAAQLKRAVAARMAVEIPSESDHVLLVAVEPDSKLGQVYSLGAHWLICGDARDPAVLASLLEAELASMVWTDPPYGVNYVGKTPDALTIENDVPDGLRERLVAAWNAATPVLARSAPFYVAGPSGALALEFLASFGEAGWDYEQDLVWVNHRFVLGRRNYHSRHEPIYHGHAHGPHVGRMAAGRPCRYGGDDADTIFEVNSPQVSREHPTMKPPELIARHLVNSSRPGEIVLDPFAGSGSTMVAAHHTGRCAYMVELDPGYCDVIRARWHKVKTDEVRPRG